jgi:hypothetical protein
MPITVLNSYKTEAIGCLRSSTPSAILRVVHKIPITYTSALEQRWYKTVTPAQDDVLRLNTQFEGQISASEMVLPAAEKIRHYHNTAYVTGDIIERPKVPYIINIMSGGRNEYPSQGAVNKAGNIEVESAILLRGAQIAYVFAVKDDPLDKTRYSAQYLVHPADGDGIPITPLIGTINVDIGNQTASFTTSNHDIASGTMMIRITASNRAGTTYYQLMFQHDF